MSKMRFIQRNKRNLYELLLLVAVLPVLIGHGASGEREVRTGNHILFSSATEAEQLYGEGRILIYINETKLMDADISSPTADAAQKNFFLHDGDVLSIEFTGSSANSTLGEIWMHGVEAFGHGNIKLIHSMIVPGQYKASFSPMESELNDPQSSTNASMSGYILSGGPTGSEALNVAGNLDLFLDGSNIYSETSTPKPPISFAATSDQILRITGVSTSSTESIGEIWLHTPDGSGIKLSHSTVSSNTANTMIDSYYSLP